MGGLAAYLDAVKAAGAQQAGARKFAEKARDEIARANSIRSVGKDRAEFGVADPDDIVAMIRKVKGLDVTEQPVPSGGQSSAGPNVSGQFTAFVVQATRDVTLGGVEFQAGAKGLVYNTTRRSSSGGATKVGDKATSPDMLGLSGPRIQRQSFLATVESAIGKAKLSGDAKAVMVGMLRSATGVKKAASGIENVRSGDDSAPLTPEAINAISDFAAADKAGLNKIGKDFGEVAGAGFLLSRYGARSVTFPEKSNNPLVDYEIDGFGISAKWKKGAAPSIKALKSKIEENREAFASPAERKFASVVDAIVAGKSGDTWYAPALIMRTPLAAKLESKFGRDFLAVADGLDRELMAKYNSLARKSKNPVESLYRYMRDEYFSLTGGREAGASPKSAANLANTIAAGGAGLWGFVVSPMGYDLRDRLNRDKGMSAALTKAARMLDVKQIYMSVAAKPKEMTFTVLPFSDATFEFHCQQSAIKPAINKMSFKPVGALAEGEEEED